MDFAGNPLFWACQSHACPTGLKALKMALQQHRMPTIGAQGFEDTETGCKCWIIKIKPRLLTGRTSINQDLSRF